MTLSLPSITRFLVRVIPLLILMLGANLLTQAQSIRYVKPAATGTGTGSSWANASGDLQAMINASSNGQQVWVATGTYKPTTTNDRTVSFSMKNGVAIYGGFTGNETALSQRVLSTPLSTTLSGDIGTAGDIADNSYHVISNPPGLTSSAVLDGFLITAGNANGSSSPNNAGGGMINNGNGSGNNCSPLIRNCLFISNSAANVGGAIFNAGYSSGTSKTSLINCAFQSNNATSLGGAIYNDGSVGGTSNPELTNCSFQANSATSGGAIGNVGFQGSSRPVLTNCVVWGNGGASTFVNGPGAGITTSYSLFESSVTGYSPGTGNLTTTVSPFVSVTDARLNGCAPAINVGDNAAYSSANGSSTDLAGNARVFPSGGSIDMGAYEYQMTGSLSISAPSVNSATVSVGFSQSFTATIGTSPYAYSVASGSLPPGLSLATTGVLSGTPTQSGSFTLTAKATDATGCSGVSAPYVLTVDPGSPIRYVRAGASGSGNSWADASGDLQNQINVDGARQVWVAQGTYKPTTGTDRTISFSMKDGVSIYGGFPATDTPTLADRNPGRFVTTLSGDIGTAGNTGDNSYHVIRNLFIGNTAVLDGFVITGGRASGTSDQPTDGKGFGGGMYNSASSPNLIDCIFQSNSASFEGGGLFNFGNSQPTVVNCSFQGNSASYGGGMSNNSSSPTVINGTFQSNTASTIGGGVYNYYGSPKLINCLFQANSATEGGGMYSSNAETTPTVINCSFQRNSAQRGGGVANAYTNVTLTNCTFQGNTASIFGGGVYNFSCSATLTNCVLFGNGESNTLYSVSGSVGATYSLLEATVTGYTGENNLTTAVYPFVSPTDASLNGCSPAINAGDNTAYNAAYPPTISSTIDLAGNPRVFPSGGNIDMGAYEYQAAPGQTPTVANPSVSTATTGSAFNQSFTTSGGSGTFSYSLASGSLPPGLSLAPTGVVSGTPTQVGSFTLTVKATDATGCTGVSTPYVLTLQLDSPIRYVRAGASGSGSSWADASGDLQGQINLVGAQQVWAAQGTYRPGTNRTISFAMKNGITILGGFPASGSPTLADRNPGSFTTVLSGDIGTIGNPNDNSYHVINNSGIDNTAVLDGFVIRDGNARGGGDQNAGGGMYNAYGSSPTLTNCSFVGNRADGGGGGFYSFNGSPTLTNCSFVGNGATVGGGVYNSGANSRLTNCSFVGNTAIQGGGGFNDGGSSTLTNCSFLRNSASVIGGALVGTNNSVLTNCVVFGNGFSSTNGYNTFYGNVTVAYSLLQAGVEEYTDGGNNVTTSTSPFISSTDARLNGCNPAINAGLNSANATTSDLANNVRVFGDRIDMGAYEFQTTGGLSLSAPGVSTATVGVAFNQSFTASGGTSPYSYSLASGSLPPGLNLAPTGVVSGTPTQAGSVTLTVTATDANGCAGVSASYTLTVTPAPAPDITLLIRAQPSIIYNTRPISVVTDVVEINAVNTAGKITLRITKDNVVSLRFDPTATSVGGRTVSNASWTFSQTSSYYELTTTSVIAGGDVLSVGLSGTLTPGAAKGNLGLSGTVMGGGETRFDNDNATTKIDYFPNL